MNADLLPAYGEKLYFYFTVSFTYQTVLALIYCLGIYEEADIQYISLCI